jgi:multidrug efflux pump subunit AcrA (membrane-fusion protein)
VFNQIKYCKIVFGIIIFLPFNVMASTDLFKTPISLSGIIEPAETLKVQSSAGGRILVLHVDENQRVSKGQLLLSLKNDSQKNKLELSRLQLKINENNVIDSKTQITISTNNVEDLETNLMDIKRRLTEEQTLFEQGSSTRSQYDSLQLQYSRGEISLKNAKLNLKKSEISMLKSQLTLERSKQELAMSEEALDDTQLKAKIGGIIITKSVEEGEIISPGAVLFQIIDINQVEIQILVEEEDLPMIEKGQAVVFTTPSYRNEEFSGKVERISWTSDPETGLFPLHVKAANPGLKLRSGMSTKVYLLKQK